MGRKGRSLPGKLEVANLFSEKLLSKSMRCGKAYAVHGRTAYLAAVNSKKGRPRRTALFSLLKLNFTGAERSLLASL